MPYVTNTALSSGRKPDILHEAVDDDDDQIPDIDCYATNRNTGNDVRERDDDIAGVDASGDVVTYAVLGFEVRACSGEEARLHCETGLYVKVVSIVGGFGRSDTSCTQTADCVITYGEEELGEVRGNIMALRTRTKL
ncbi:hypothetical protein LSH36_942g01089 [Paralvinella palmiformis]|uniref:Uncharacterized protein n=1 Tax=Paralvinella palmiformis TaxID=53620 RepID=A0AAD9MQT4_9ANNE|nr:hypothetical protein LSH36_942g01089 [Paralvinella palmiformis]